MNSQITSVQYPVLVIGGGAWGTVLTQLFQHQGATVQQWSRRSELPLAPAAVGCKIILSAVSMAGVGATLEQLQPLPIPPETILVTATKGLDRATHKTPSQLWQATFPHNPIVVLSGPNLSAEIQAGLPAATVVASQELAAAQTVQQMLASERFRVYVNADPLGTELGGTIKNVMAIAAGVCDGLALGTNAKAALLTRALPEMVRVGVALGAKPETFVGLAGLGDLLATCSSSLSRNYQVGYGLGQGRSLSEVLVNLSGTAEGINTTQVLVQWAEKAGLTVPIATAVQAILQQTLSPTAAVEQLMARDLTTEADDLFKMPLP
ncbi:MAG: NAD(P)H-dependent glycerol-3-phosphate dehydrogenase [Spirulina sp. SIO3F2]|nr:NAD(P)H-dependent glycerol-3-phosphate dehydrogenase [Spirulina sp. SIO3F2]